MSDTIVVTSPVFESLEGLNYESEVIDGKKIIKNFTSIEDELNSLFNGVGLRDISYKGVIELKGKDVLDFLHRITTNTLKDLPKEKIQHTIFTNEKGRIIDLGTLLNFEDYQLLICNSSYENKVKSWIDRYVITDDVKTANINGKYTILELSGPQASSFLMFTLGAAVNNVPDNYFRVIHSEGMLFFLAKLLQRNGSIKYWLIADAENGRKIAKYMSENTGPYDFSFIGKDAYNIFRIHQGIPAAPGELNDTINPHEAGLMDFVDTKKGCYIGQEVIARLDTYDKVQKYLMGIIFNEPVPEGESYQLFDNEGTEAGFVTSMAYSPRCKKQIALAYVRKAYAEEGKELTAKNQAGAAAPVIVKNLPIRK